MPGFVFLINFDVLFHVCVLETSRVNLYMNNKQSSRVSPSFNTTSDNLRKQTKIKKQSGIKA